MIISRRRLPDRRLARMLAGVRATAWEQIVAGNQDRLPTVTIAGKPPTHPTGADGDDGDGEPVTVIRVDATIIEAATMKPGVAGYDTGGIGFHPLTAWCTNTGDHLVVMQRPGSAGSFTAADHVAVLDAALAQIPVEHRSDLLVTIDGAGASHAMIQHLTSWNTAREHGRPGTAGGVLDRLAGRRADPGRGEQLPETAWTVRLTTDPRMWLSAAARLRSTPGRGPAVRPAHGPPRRS